MVSQYISWVFHKVAILTFIKFKYNDESECIHTWNVKDYDKEYA